MARALHGTTLPREPGAVRAVRSGGLRGLRSVVEELDSVVRGRWGLGARRVTARGGHGRAPCRG